MNVNNGLIHLKLAHIVVYENSSNKFDFEIFPHLKQYKLPSPISALAHIRKL